MLRAHVDDAIFRQRGAADADEVVPVSTLVPPHAIPLACHLNVARSVEERARERRANPDGHEDNVSEPPRRTLPHPEKLLATYANTTQTDGTALLG